MTNLVKLRDEFREFLRIPSDERDELFSRLDNDERRAFMYQCHHLPLGAQFDPNQLPSPPFSDREMHRLLTAANAKVGVWIVKKLLEDHPPTFLTSK
jgi:hypothetical protein